MNGSRGPRGGRDPTREGVNAPCTAPAQPLAHLLHHPPALGHRVEEALDHLELLHGQKLGLRRDSPDKEGGNILRATGWPCCDPPICVATERFQASSPPFKFGVGEQGPFFPLGKLRPRKVR